MDGYQKNRKIYEFSTRERRYVRVNSNYGRFSMEIYDNVIRLKNKSLIILVLIFAISCNNQNYDKKECIQILSNALEIKLPTNCMLVDYKTNSSIGDDYTLTFGLEYPPLEFDSLLVSLDTNNMHLSNDGRLYVYEPLNCRNCTYISVTISKIDRTIYYGCIEE